MPTFVKPETPGTVIRFVGEAVVSPAPSFAEVVAIPLVHNWGPLGSDSGGLKLVRSFQEWEAIYGSDDTAGRTAVLGAFNGIGVGDEAGAGGVLVYRMAAPAAAKATVNVPNTAVGNPTALTLAALYTGTRGNSISYATEDDPSDLAKDQLRILFNGATVERYRYTPTDITALAAAINTQSRYVTATSVATGVALVATAGTALTGGNSGDTLLSAQWLAALAAFEFQSFGLFAPYNLTDAAIRASVVAWLNVQQEEMRPVMAVFGGVAGESVSDALARSVLLADDPDIVNLGVGTYRDDLLGKDLSTAQLAPRLAGVLAARGDEHALTYAQLGGLSPVGSTAPATDTLKALAAGGVTALRRTSDPNAELVVSWGVTTFNNIGQVGMPHDIFSEPRMVRIMHNFIRNMKAWADDKVIGDLTVTDDTRAAVRAEGRSMLDDLLSRGLILPGNTENGTIEPFINVEDPNDPALADAIPFEFGWHFARTANYVIGHGRVR